MLTFEQNVYKVLLMEQNEFEEEKPKVKKTGKIKRIIKKFFLYFVTLIVVLVVVGIILVVINTKSSDGFERQTPIVTVVEPVRRDVNETLSFSGYIESNLMAPVVSYVAGKVLSVDVEAGEQVKKNDILVRIAPEDYADVTAPEDGTVLTTMVKAGDMVNQGTLVGLIGDLNNLVVNLNIPERFVKDIKLGQKAHIYHKNTNSTLVGEVTVIEPFVNPQSKTFKTKIVLNAIDNKDRWAVPGMAVDVDIIYKEHKNVYTVTRATLNHSELIYMLEDNEVKVWEDDYIGDENYIIVPEEHAKKFFLVKGQNKVFPGQRVDIEIQKGDNK